MNLEDEYDAHSLGDELDNAILMHREAHFGGKFDLMLEYYEKGGKGIYPDFDLNRIQYLAVLEEKSSKNLAADLLTAAEVEKVLAAKKAYKTLKDQYEKKIAKNKHAILLANLILSEEENPEKEIEAIVAENKTIVEPLLKLVRSEDFYDPLFPGYGKAPLLAIRCLGKIGSPQAIIALFESIGKGDFFDDDVALKALREIGQPAKDFLLKVLRAKPINEDNERAAIALLTFKNDPEIAKVCLDLLLTLDLKKDHFLATYLILACEGLKGSLEEMKFISLLDKRSFPKDLKADIECVLKEWKQNSLKNLR